MHDAAAIAAGGATAGALLTIAHLALWEREPPLTLVQRYVIGVGALNLGLTLTGALLGDWRLPVAAWAVAGCGGAAVGALHLWRETGTGAELLRLMRRGARASGRGVGDGAWEADRGNDRRA